MVVNAVKNLPAGKTSVSNDIPVSIMKATIDTYCLKLKQVMNDCLKNNFFPDILKTAEIISCFKKGDKGEKKLWTNKHLAKLFKSFREGNI